MSEATPMGYAAMAFAEKRAFAAEQFRRRSVAYDAIAEAGATYLHGILAAALEIDDPHMRPVQEQILSDSEPELIAAFDAQAREYAECAAAGHYQEQA